MSEENQITAEDEAIAAELRALGGEEAQTEEGTEPEGVTEKPAEEVEPLKDEAGTKEDPAEPEKEEPKGFDVSKELGLDPDKVKATLGRVSKLQSDGDKNGQRLSKLEEAMERYFERLTPKDKEQLLDGDGLIEMLQSKGEAGLKDYIERVADQRVSSLRAENETIKSQLMDQKAQNSYADTLEQLSGDDWGRLSPIYDQIVQAVAEQAEAGNEKAIKMKADFASSPRLLYREAQHLLGKQVRDLGNKADAEAEKEASGAGSFRSKGSKAPAKPKDSSEDEFSFLSGGL